MEGTARGTQEGSSREVGGKREENSIEKPGLRKKQSLILQKQSRKRKNEGNH